MNNNINNNINNNNTSTNKNNIRTSTNNTSTMNDINNNNNIINNNINNNNINNNNYINICRLDPKKLAEMCVSEISVAFKKWFLKFFFERASKNEWTEGGLGCMAQM